MESTLTSKEILINASHVVFPNFGDLYEFILNKKLQVVECVKIDSLVHGVISRIENVTTTLEGMLFELNHVRINPRLNNIDIINCLTNALKDINVQVSNQPANNSAATCFKPLGEISDTVRFYLSTHNKVVFLSHATKPKLISIKSKKFN
jgi:hypothetical protein